MRPGPRSCPQRASVAEVCEGERLRSVWNFYQAPVTFFRAIPELIRYCPCGVERAPQSRVYLRALVYLTAMKILCLTAVLLGLAGRTVVAQQASGAVLVQARIIPAFAASFSAGGSAVPATTAPRGVVGVTAGVPALISVRVAEAGAPREHEQATDTLRAAPPPPARASPPHPSRSSPAPVMSGRTITISVAVN